jgi:hypothetical protein
MAPVDPIGGATQIAFLPGPDFINAWNQSWNPPNLYFGTPLDLAFSRANDALGSGTLTGRTAIVVLTDGEPTCRAAPLAETFAAQWFAQGIRTYVVGLPGATGAVVLDDIAVAGGTMNYLLPGDSMQLEQEIANITSTIVERSLDECTIAFNQQPENLDDVHLIVTEAATSNRLEVLQGPAEWELSADGSGATLLGATCEEAKAGAFANIEFQFGCVDVPIRLPM